MTPFAQRTQSRRRSSLDVFRDEVPLWAKTHPLKPIVPLSLRLLRILLISGPQWIIRYCLSKTIFFFGEMTFVCSLPSLDFLGKGLQGNAARDRTPRRHVKMGKKKWHHFFSFFLFFSSSSVTPIGMRTGRQRGEMKRPYEFIGERRGSSWSWSWSWAQQCLLHLVDFDALEDLMEMAVVIEWSICSEAS